MSLNWFTYCMSGGQWLRSKRLAMGLSQGQLAERITDSGYPVTSGYISIIEREYDKNKKGLPTRVNEDLVDAFAKVLHTDVNEARTAFNYAPGSSDKMMNVEGLRFSPLDADQYSEDELKELQDTIRISFEIFKRRIEEKRNT